ncbi:hypothetical protein CR513_01894, partial [Mucuna pruriens]
MGGNKSPTQMWVNQTTSNEENVVEHPSTLQLDQDIQAFSKEEMDRLRALLISTSKPLGSYALTMKVSKKQLITAANENLVPIVGSRNVQLKSSLSLHNVLHVPKLANNLISIDRLIQDWNCAVTFFRSHCVVQDLTMGRMIEVTTPIKRICLLVNGQPQKLGQLIKFGFIINVLDIHRLVYLRQCFHICLQKNLSSPLIAMFLNFQNTIVRHFLLVIIKVLRLQNGVVHELTCVNTLQQIRVEKGKNCHLLEVARALLFQMSIPNVY